MEFKIEEDENINITLINNKLELAKAICYYKNTPKVNENNIGCIGEFEAKSLDDGVILLRKCEELLKEKNIKYIVGPMNGNTWKQYRTLKWTNEEPEFLLEKVNPIEQNEIFKQAGFDEIEEYTSNKGYIKDRFESEILDLIEENIEKEGIKIRKFDKENYEKDLKKIYNVSIKSFSRNPFYTDISEKDFLLQYTNYINMVDDELILIAEKNGEEIGFVFSIPNFNEIKLEGKCTSIILKTIAVLPEYEDLGIGNIMLRKISNIALKKGYEKWIFAFMYSKNTSQKMAKRNNAYVIRKYALYGKYI